MACTAGPAGIDRTMTVAGGELDVWCDGGEGPTIIFLAAIGGDDTLLPIAERFSDEANACFYFRPVMARPPRRRMPGLPRAMRPTSTSSSCRPS